jgi:alanyl-tRNA synthetase
LRFDFSHYAAMTPEELTEVERLINQHIIVNDPVVTDEMELDEALKTGAMALFGEKYGEKVRVVKIDTFSKELCGGIHVKRTGDIGMCKIVYEGSISAGVRRIEAVTGEDSLRRFQDSQRSLARLAHLTRGSESDVVEQIERLLHQQKALEKQLEQMKDKVAHALASELEAQAHTVGQARVLAARVEGMERTQLRTLVDALRNKWKSAVVLLATSDDSGVTIVGGVTKDLTAKVHAGKLVGTVAQAVGGKGGGRPDLAEAGGKDAAALPGALEAAYASIEGMLK